MKRWPFRRKSCLLALLIAAAVFFPAVSQWFIPEELNTYLKYNSALFSEYMEAEMPYMNRWINDPNYSYEDFLSDTRLYYEEMRRKSSEYQREYNRRSRSVRNAYREASAVLRQAYYSGGGAGGMTQDQFDNLTVYFSRR